MSDNALLVLIAPANRRDDIVDALMLHESISGFSVTEAAGFSRAHSQLSQRERVQGFGDYDRFEVLCDTASRQALLRAVSEVLGRDHVRFWVLPVVDHGVLPPVT